MNSSILVNGSQRSELVILVSKGKRYGPIMATVPANKENVSPEKEIECLSDSFQKNLTMNHVEKDGRYFLDVVERESERLTRLCQATEQEMSNKSLPEDACGKIRAANGKAKLLVNKKFKQFKGLCDMNLGIGETNGRRPTNGDLAGFWDMVMIQVDDVNSMFSNIDELRKNGWTQTQPSPDETDSSKRSSLTRQSSLSRQSSLGKGSVRRQKSKEEIKATEAEQRAAARKRLAAAKRTARQKMLQKNNSLDDVEIFCSPKNPKDLSVTVTVISTTVENHIELLGSRVILLKLDKQNRETCQVTNMWKVYGITELQIQMQMKEEGMETIVASLADILRAFSHVPSLQEPICNKHSSSMGRNMR